MNGSSPRRRPEARVRFYFDADILGVAKVIASVRPDATYPGDPGGEVRKRYRAPSPVTDPGAKDIDWIPRIAHEGWSIITRDRHIAVRPSERTAVIDHGAKLFTLVRKENLSLWQQLEILLRRWRDIEQHSGDPGPFIYAIHRTRVTQLL